jgi:hypothetical protein
MSRVRKLLVVTGIAAALAACQDVGGPPASGFQAAVDGGPSATSDSSGSDRKTRDQGPDAEPSGHLVSW